MKTSDCPFCGGNTRVQAYRKCYAAAWARVMCCATRLCGARGPTVRRSIKNPEDFQALKDAAATAWESRLRAG